MQIIKNSIHRCQVTAMTNEGNGVVKIDDFVIFVPNTAIGDIIDVKIVKVLKNYGFGIIDKLIEASDTRTDNACNIFNQCGGCCFRHINYKEQLRIKQQAVKDAFERIGSINAQILPIEGSQFIDRYRNKAQYPVGINKDGKAIAGFYAKRSHRIIECKDCLLQPDIFNNIVNSVLEFINQYKINVYNEQTKKGLIRHIYLRIADATGEIMLCIVATGENIPKQKEFIEYITLLYPQIKSIVININKKDTNVILGDKCNYIYGDGYINDIICGIKVRISPLAFYQVNKKQAEKLYNKALEFAKLTKDDILFDLYCGTGTIGLAAAKYVKQIIGVEIIPQAIEDAKINAKINNINNALFICDDCKGAVKKLKQQGISPDIIIVDPPRKGCDIDVITSICDLLPDRIIMVSCNPATAARDCRLLVEFGYTVEKYMPFDLFPNTAHVECVVLMSRVEK